AIELEPVRGDAVLPAWQGPHAEGDQRWPAELRGQAWAPGDRSAEALFAFVRQCAPPLPALREGVLRLVREGGLEGHGQAQVPLQEQARELGLDDDRSVPVDVRLGEVHAYQGGGEAAPGARSRRLPAQVRRHHRWQG